MDRKIIVTNDDSTSLYIPDLDETYHSRHGARQESMHVFIQSGLNHLQDLKHVKIFEMGFGTGLNAFLTWKENCKNHQTIEYVGIEKHPLQIDLVKNLNFAETDKEKAIFDTMHNAEWNKDVDIDEKFKLHKIKGDILDECLNADYFDILYYDAFGPKTQPQLWSHDICLKLYEILHNNGVIVTYCAQGQFKRNLKNVGFEVEELPGPPGKREMTRAIKH